MPTDDAFYVWGKGEPIDAANLTKRPMDLHLRVKALEAVGDAVEYIRRQVDDTVLAQAENVLAGLRAQLAAIVDLHWLTGTSTTPVALVAGQERALILPDDQRVLFAPGPFAVVQRVSDPGVYAVVQTLNYDRGLGQFDFNVLTVAGAPGTYADWSIAAVAGSTLAQMTLLSQGLAAKAASDADAAAARADRLLSDQDAQAAGASATAAAGSATAAAASAAAAERLGAALIFTARSASAVPIGLGAVTVALTAATVPHFAPLSRLALISAADGRLAMSGNLVSYDPTAGALTLMVDQASGSGSPADWIVTPAPPSYLGGVVDGGDDDLGPPPPYQTSLLPADFGALVAIVASAAFTGTLPAAPTGRWGALYLDNGVAVVDRTGPAPGTPGAPPLVLPGDFASISAFLSSPAFTSSLPTAPPQGGGLYLDNDVLTGA